MFQSDRMSSEFDLDVGRDELVEKVLEIATDAVKHTTGGMGILADFRVINEKNFQKVPTRFVNGRKILVRFRFCPKCMGLSGEQFVKEMKRINRRIKLNCRRKKR